MLITYFPKVNTTTHTGCCQPTHMDYITWLMSKRLLIDQIRRRFWAQGLIRTWELRKLSYKLSLVNSHQLSCKQEFDQELRKFSYKISLVNSHQLSCNSCYSDDNGIFVSSVCCLRVGTRTWELRKLSYQLSLANSRQLSCISCSCLTRTWHRSSPG